jgi:hypothetical protein
MPHGIDDETAELIRTLIDDAELSETLWLIKNGIPFDVAFALDPIDRFVWSVIFGKFEGAKFNLDTLEFERSDP